MFGIVLGLSDAILGLTFLAWGNSLGGKFGLFPCSYQFLFAEISLGNHFTCIHTYSFIQTRSLVYQQCPCVFHMYELLITTELKENVLFKKN